MDAEAEEKLLAQNLLSAARRRDVTATRNLLRKASANVQDAATGFTPLHAAVQGSEDEPTTTTTIASSGAKPGDRSEDEERPVLEIVQLLFENGAIWNDLDGNGETPGCIAWRLGYRRVYRAIVDAGVRAELLLSKLDELDADADTDDDDDGGGGGDEHDGSDDGAAAAPSEPASDYIDHWSSNAAFLRSTLRYGATQLLDSSSNAVMMSWETEIMARHAALLLPAPGLAVMNIGHGMGIVDAALQSHRPARHHIVEAHADVLARMRAEGWYERPGVVVHEGRWQEVLPRLLTQGAVELDAVYYDTFAEHYADLKELFTEYVVGLLREGGRFGFYHGLGADRRVSYDVYTNVVELDLLDAGLETEWEEIEVPTIDWQGVRRSYWNVDVYRLPTCRFQTA